MVMVVAAIVAAVRDSQTSSPFATHAVLETPAMRIHCGAFKHAANKYVYNTETEQTQNAKLQPQLYLHNLIAEIVKPHTR